MYYDVKDITMCSAYCFQNVIHADDLVFFFFLFFHFLHAFERILLPLSFAVVAIIIVKLPAIVTTKRKHNHKISRNIIV